MIDQKPLHLLKRPNNENFYDPQLSTETSQQIKNISEDTQKVKMSKTMILKNLLVISFVRLLITTADKSVVNLQSSINHTLGTISLTANQVAFAFSGLFLPSLMINMLGFKRTIATCIPLNMLYAMANFYPQWYTLTPTAVLAGLGSGPMWTAECAYLTALSGEYGSWMGQPVENLLGYAFGIFNFIYLTCHIWGNLISYYVLKPMSIDPIDKSYNTSSCGASFCNKWTNESHLEQRPMQEQFYTLHAIYTGCVILAELIVIFLLYPLQDNTELRKTPASYMETWKTVIRHLRHEYQLLLIPLSVYSGMEQAYIAGDFTKAYLSCGMGVYHIGFVMICYGVANSVSSFAVGALLKVIGRIAIIFFGTTLNLLTILLMFLWQPAPDSYDLYFIIAGLWGVGDAVWTTVITTMYGVLFYDCKVAAFANLRLWKSVGSCITFAYSSFLCMQIKLWILTGTLVIGILAYVAIEVHVRSSKDKPIDSEWSAKAEKKSLK